MLIKRQIPHAIDPSEITDKSVFENRRDILRGGAAAALGITLPGLASSAMAASTLPEFTNNAMYDTDEALTKKRAAQSYNNFYEFGLDKDAPARNADSMKTRPWTVEVGGECENPKTWDIDDLIKAFPLEQRIYRLRCVEAWSMVIPWIGFELGALVKASKPTSKAKYLRMETLYDPEQMPGQKKGLFGVGLDWPYVEGLRIDEAVHPLTLFSVGAYDEVLPNQSGAPIRLVVPWKYGFKSIKSIVKVEFTEQEPVSTWNKSAPREYGFYANVNPEVNHPRWSQARERRVGKIGKRDTLMLNGYADQVASLYEGMDMTKFF